MGENVSCSQPYLTAQNSGKGCEGIEITMKMLVHSLTNVDVWEPDEVGCVGVEEDVVVARLVAEEVLHLQPRVAPVQPQRRLQRDQLQGRKGYMTSELWTTPTLLLHLNNCILYRVPLNCRSLVW